jgi:glucuronate isomerase
MTQALMLHPDRLFPADAGTRGIARDIYQSVRDLPIVSPHGHCDPVWFADNAHFADAAELLVVPDHYVYRMLYSQGVPLEQLGVGAESRSTVDSRDIWRTFAAHYHCFAGTPSRIWLDSVFAEVFGLEERLDSSTADAYFDAINAALATADFRPRALFERFNIEVLATTESPLDELEAHQRIQASGWTGRVVTSYRPDCVVDPDYENFAANLERFGELTNSDVSTWEGYLDAHRNRRAYFRRYGATSTDHGHPSAATADLDRSACEDLYQRVSSGGGTAQDAELFRAQMITEMARMSLDDGMVLQLHAGCYRNHNPQVFERFGRDRGADIPLAGEYVNALAPLLGRFGNERDLTIVVFTLDESCYSRELAPLAGHYPALKLGPPWWFHDSPEGMRRFREQVTETAGFYNTVGFNDDTRAFMSIPARHDVARRMDSTYLAQLVAEHRLDMAEAQQIAQDLSYNLVKSCYRL